MTSGTDYLSSTTTRSPRGPVPAMTAIAIGVASVLVATVGTAVAVGSAIGGGQQPEDVLPASAIAVVKVDLAPSLGQRKALYDISKKFSSIHAKSVESVKDDLLASLFENGQDELDYTTDIKPWLGDRIAIAAVPDGKGSVQPVAAVQYTDKAKATKTLDEAKKKSASDPFAFGFDGDYVVVATTQAEVDRYAKADKHLSDSELYKTAVDALDGDQLVLGWADVKGLYGVLPADTRKQAKLDADPSGSFVIGAHADSSFLEIRGKAVDVGDSLKQYGADAVASLKGHNLIGTFPVEATGAIEATGLGEAFTKSYDKLATSESFGPINEGASQFGLTLPDDLKTVFGTDFAAGLFGSLKTNPRFIAHVKTDDPDKAVSILSGIPSEEDKPPFAVEKDNDGGYFLGSDAGAITLATNGKLGDSAPFKRALPDAEDASFALYVSIGRAAEFAGATPKDLTNLEALGVTASGENGEFRIRLTFR